MQGIGRAVALLFSKEGAKVVINECVLVRLFLETCALL